MTNGSKVKIQAKRQMYETLGRLPFAASARFQIKALKYNLKLKAPEAQEEFKRVLPETQGKISIDLGANVGTYTKLLANYSKLVIAFEPDPWAFEQLKGNVAGIKHVKLENAAAGSLDGVVKLYRHQEFEHDKRLYSEASSLCYRRDFTHEDCVDVDQVDFIRYIENLDSDIGIVKMDIEGMELELLEALLDRPDLLARIGYIFVETHERLFPDKLMRFNRIREQVRLIERPRINLNWH